MPHSHIRYPILGLLTQQQLKDTLLKSIADEATAIDFYGRLMQQAPNELGRDTIEHIREDEMFHLQNFENLFMHYFGAEPQYAVTPVQFSSYGEGLLMALDDELNAAEFYRDVQLSVKDPLVRDTYYLPMVDELEHATRFSTLYNTR